MRISSINQEKKNVKEEITCRHENVRGYKHITTIK